MAENGRCIASRMKARSRFTSRCSLRSVQPAAHPMWMATGFSIVCAGALLDAQGEKCRRSFRAAIRRATRDWKRSNMSLALPPSAVRVVSGNGWRLARELRGRRRLSLAGGSAVQLRLDVEDDPGDRVVIGGIRRELNLGERDSSESDDDESSRCGDAGKVSHWDFLSRCREN